MLDGDEGGGIVVLLGVVLPGVALELGVSLADVGRACDVCDVCDDEGIGSNRDWNQDCNSTVVEEAPANTSINETT